MALKFEFVCKWISYLYLLVVLLLYYIVPMNMFYVEIGFIGFTLLAYALFTKRINLCKAAKIWLMPIAYSIFTLIFSMDKSSTIRFIFLVVFFWWFILFFYICAQRNYYKIVRVLWVLSGSHVCFSLWQSIDGKSFYSFYRMFSTASSLNDNLFFFNHGRMCGITNQTGINGFLISLFIVITICDLFDSKKISVTAFKILLSTVSITMLTLTGKRIFFVAIIFIFAFLFLVKGNMASLKRKAKYFVVAAVSVWVILTVLINNGMVAIILNKFIKNYEKGDVSNGRFEMWNLTMQQFRSNPLFGTGLNSMIKLIGSNSHNVFIEILAETGIFGFAIFCAAILYPFFRLLRYLIKKRKNCVSCIHPLAIQLLFLLYCLTGNPFFDHKIMWIYSLSVGIGEAVIGGRVNGDFDK